VHKKVTSEITEAGFCRPDFLYSIKVLKGIQATDRNQWK